MLLNDSKSKSKEFEKVFHIEILLETSRILIDIERVIENTTVNSKNNNEDIENLRRALDFSSAIRRKNYSRFFSVYRSLPSLAACLVNLFIDIYRKHLLKALVWG